MLTWTKLAVLSILDLDQYGSSVEYRPESNWQFRQVQTWTNLTVPLFEDCYLLGHLVNKEILNKQYLDVKNISSFQ